ncbi:bifunctional alpha/beta hydrolase/OsmC family protein [Legionella feeleii]|uniref:Alpha/beta superfamily hydrolase n=1 Tax=Legionella feeleii TaxID=453 RepID=A0A378IVE4_9GAMM|nr:bifunctional alpha/beta hydrolase/OsmC family protein [Legionella feeleii]STX39023.1 alpha/beta superfamily hydrolase [Legionella feeleii]
MQKTIYFYSNNMKLEGKLELPVSECFGCVLFAHCFTCGKDIAAARSISKELALNGFAVLRFDFTGLGRSEGNFSETNFSSNVEDLVAAADFLRKEYQAPEMLIGHSLGGAAVLLAAKQIKEVQAVATIGAPATAQHVKEHFSADLTEIEDKGSAKVKLGPKQFSIKKQFLEDIDQYQQTIISTKGKALLIMHSPSDKIVSIDEAEKIYKAAAHPKSFISLDKADHLLSQQEDAQYAAKVIAAWASRYLINLSVKEKQSKSVDKGHVVVEEKDHIFTQRVYSDDHQWLADEPEQAGGQNLGPDPYEHLLAALGACTAMTIRLVANKQQWPLDSVQVELSHARLHQKDCDECDDSTGYMETIKRTVTIKGKLSTSQKERLEQIADRCPVHKTLSQKIDIETKIEY